MTISAYQFVECPWEQKHVNTCPPCLFPSPEKCPSRDLHSRILVCRMKLTSDTFFVHFWEEFCVSPRYLTQYCPAVLALRLCLRSENKTRGGVKLVLWASRRSQQNWPQNPILHLSPQQARTQTAKRQHCPIYTPAWAGLLRFHTAFPEDVKIVQSWFWLITINCQILFVGNKLINCARPSFSSHLTGNPVSCFYLCTWTRWFCTLQVVLHIIRGQTITLQQKGPILSY